MDNDVTGALIQDHSDRGALREPMNVAQIEFQGSIDAP